MPRSNKKNAVRKVAAKTKMERVKRVLDLENLNAMTTRIELNPVPDLTTDETLHVEDLEEFEQADEDGCEYKAIHDVHRRFFNELSNFMKEGTFSFYTPLERSIGCVNGIKQNLLRRIEEFLDDEFDDDDNWKYLYALICHGYKSIPMYNMFAVTALDNCNTEFYVCFACYHTHQFKDARFKIKMHDIETWLELKSIFMDRGVFKVATKCAVCSKYIAHFSDKGNLSIDKDFIDL